MASVAGRIKLGSQGLEVSAQGLGCMGMSYGYGQTNLDTSDTYGPHANEILIGKALKGVSREKVQIAPKFAVKPVVGGGTEICRDSEYAKQACESSSKRLNVDYVDLYYVHRIDKRVPIKITICFILLSIFIGLSSINCFMLIEH